MVGIVVKGKLDNLVVNSISDYDPDFKTQQGLSLLPFYIKKFNLVEGDKVEYSHGGLYEHIEINHKLLN